MCLTEHNIALAMSARKLSHHVSSMCLRAAREVHQPAAAQHKGPGGQGQRKAAASELRQDQGLCQQCQSAGPGRAESPLSHRYSTLPTLTPIKQILTVGQRVY